MTDIKTRECRNISTRNGYGNASSYCFMSFGLDFCKFRMFLFIFCTKGENETKYCNME